MYTWLDEDQIKLLSLTLQPRQVYSSRPWAALAGEWEGAAAPTGPHVTRCHKDRCPVLPPPPLWLWLCRHTAKMLAPAFKTDQDVQCPYSYS